MREGTHWTKEEEEELRVLIGKNYTKQQLMAHFGRTKFSILNKVNRLGLQIQNTSDNVGNRGRNWTPNEIKKFKELWADGGYSIPMLEKAMNRTWYSLRKKAFDLGLGPRSHNLEFLSYEDVCREMHVNYCKVSRWAESGLKTHRNKSGKTRRVIDADDLLEFLKEHPTQYDASLISPYLFPEEPDWLIEKRERDAKFFPKKNWLEYTNEEDKKIVYMFKRGKTDEEIAKELKRTSVGIADRRRILNLSRREFNEYEIDILKKNSDYLTISEMSKLLPLRTESGIMWKCEQLKLPYHVSKTKCATK
jgi:hypothetical protein